VCGATAVEIKYSSLKFENGTLISHEKNKIFSYRVDFENAAGKNAQNIIEFKPSKSHVFTKVISQQKTVPFA
jgi:hypothetical protein